MLRRASGLRSIPTQYKGVEFRSRAEARWAVALDEAGIKWAYEPEGYALRTHWYLPDFWLPQCHCFAEVKGVAQQFDEESITKAHELAQATSRTVLLWPDLVECPPGVPWTRYVSPNDDTGVLNGWINLTQSVAKGEPWYECDDPQNPSVQEWAFDLAWHSAQLTAANYFKLAWQS